MVPLVLELGPSSWMRSTAEGMKQTLMNVHTVKLVFMTVVTMKKQECSAHKVQLCILCVHADQYVVVTL